VALVGRRPRMGIADSAMGSSSPSVATRLFRNWPTQG
jgi:hypothetical protein